MVQTMREVLLLSCFGTSGAGAGGGILSKAKEVLVDLPVRRVVVQGRREGGPW